MPQILTTDYSQQITCIDTHYKRPNLAACYLIESAGEAVFIDTGTSHTVPHLMAVLAAKGVSPSQVKYVIPTHVHLDHAGGAGTLMRQLPNASLLIHPFGAKHMIDPSRLIAGAKAVYGEERFSASFGELVGIDEQRIIEAPDGLRVTFGDRELLCLDTPGHARHHICIHDALSSAIFTGDTFGLSYREFDTRQGPFIMPTTTPVQFDLDAWQVTLDRLMDLSPEKIFLTHYGEVTEPVKLADKLSQYLDDFAAIARAADSNPGRERIVVIHKALQQWLIDKLQAHGCEQSPETIVQMMSMDLELDAQGLEVWLARQEK